MNMMIKGKQVTYIGSTQTKIGIGWYLIWLIVFWPFCLVVYGYSHLNRTYWFTINGERYGVNRKVRDEIIKGDLSSI